MDQSRDDRLAQWMTHEHVLEWNRWKQDDFGRVDSITRKAAVANSTTYLKQPPVFEWHVISCGSENEYQKAPCV